jgi:anti-sigma B factor antagonist
MQIETRKVDDILIVHVTGRLDTTASAEAGGRVVVVVQGEEKRIVFKPENPEYVSSAGLRLILLSSKLLPGRHGELKICGLNHGVGQVPETSGFNSLLKGYPSEKEAVAAFPA